VPALYTSIQAVLSLYASGRTTGVVLDAGDGVSHAVPVFQGFTVPNSIRRIDVAGRDVTEYLQTLLRKSGYVFHTSAEKEVVRLIKEAVTYVAKDPRKEEKEWAAAKLDQGKVAEYVLPDGNKLKVCPRLFFGLLTNQAGVNVGVSPRSAQNASARPRSSSTRKSSGSSTPACTRSWSTRSTGRTWTCARTCTPTLCSRAAAR
jgi:actin-related protein